MALAGFFSDPHFGHVNIIGYVDCGVDAWGYGIAPLADIEAIIACGVG